MRLLASSVALTAVLAIGACGGAAPQESAAPAAAASAGDREELRRLESLGRSNPTEAIAGLEAYTAKFPDDPRGQWVLAMTVGQTVTALPGQYTDADRTATERAAQHYRKALELKPDDSLREASYMGLMHLYGPLKLNRPEEVIEPARQLIAMSATLGTPHYHLANALADLERTDEAVQVWSDALTQVPADQRRDIAVGIQGFASLNELTAPQVRRLVDVLNKIIEDVDHPEPRAHAVALKLRAQYLEKDPAASRALLQQSAEWEKLADEAVLKSLDEVKRMVDELQGRTESKR